MIENHQRTQSSATSPDDGDVTIPARLLVCDSPLPVAERFDSPLDRKRKAVWHNEPRNRLVASLATGFADNQIELLWNAGLLLDQQAIPWRAAWTAVLVESPEHAWQLQSLLPTWQVIHASGGSALPGAAQFSLQASHQTIITLVAAATMTSFSPDVLIVPMGGQWAFDLPNLVVPASGREMLIVDVVDDFDAVACEATRTRLRTYAGKGWHVQAGSKWLPLWPERRDGVAGKREPQATIDLLLSNNP